MKGPEPPHWLQNRVCMYVCMYVCMQAHAPLLENITTEPHAQDISADIMRLWLSGYILQYIYIYIYIYIC